MGFGTACCKCARECQKHNHKMEVAYKFFKLMFGKDYQNLLYLPPKFARTVQYLVDQETEIEDANGKCWSVTVSKVKNSLAFQKGWLEFFEGHNLKRGDLLVFKYIKGSHFSVTIFGKSATEIIEMPSQNKRPRIGQVTASEGEPLRTADADSGVKPTTTASGAVESEFQTLQTNLEVKNAVSGGMQHVSVSRDVEDQLCMIINDRNDQEEDKRILLDLSCFEMQNKTCDQSDFQKGLSTNLDPSGDAEQTKTMGNDAETGMVGQSPTKGHSGDFVTQKLEKLQIMDQMKGLSGDILNVESEKAMETEIVAEITNIKSGGIQEVVTHSSQTAGRQGDIDTSKFSKKHSDNRNTRKGAFGDDCNVQNGKHTINIRKEQMKMENQGKEPALVQNADLMSSPEVKVELDISPPQAEVKSKSYMELPAAISPIREKRDLGEWKVVYLVNSTGERLPVLYPRITGFKALTVNWGKFCDNNSIKPGDECRFTRVQNEYGECYRVEDIRRCETPQK